MIDAPTHAGADRPLANRSRVGVRLVSWGAHVRGSQLPCMGETEEARTAVRHDHMIDKSQSDGLGRQGQKLGEVAVLGAGLHLAARMIVRGDKAGSPGHQHGTQDPLIPGPLRPLSGTLRDEGRPPVRWTPFA